MAMLSVQPSMAVQELVEYSLELSCQEQFLGQAQRAAIGQAAVRALQGPATPSTSPLGSPRLSGEYTIPYLYGHLMNYFSCRKTTITTVIACQYTVQSVGTNHKLRCRPYLDSGRNGV